MAEQSPIRQLALRSAYLGLSLVVIFFHLLPLEISVSRWAGPDLLTALTFAWALRRPELVPSLSIVGVMLLADLLFQRPPGLWAAIVLIAAEFLKSRERNQKDVNFLVEWATVALLLFMMTVAYRAALIIVITDPGPLFLSTMQAAMTIVIYPLVVIFSRLVFGIRRAAPGEVDSLGQRL